jgi:hypothetical protein
MTQELCTGIFDGLRLESSFPGVSSLENKGQIPLLTMPLAWYRWCVLAEWTMNNRATVGAAALP